MTPFQCFQLTIAIMLLFGSGLAACFTLWIIPLLQLPRVPPQAKTAMFVQLFTWGGQYLQPCSQLLGLSLAIAACWAYAADNNVWRYYAVSFAIAAPLAIWEVYFIFPYNDEVKAIDERLRRPDSKAFSDEEEESLNLLLTKWSNRHVVRFGLGLIAGIMSAVALL